MNSLLLLCSCDDRPQEAPAAAPAPAPPAELVDSPSFNGHNAYVHCDAICKLGPRYSGTAAYEAQLQLLEKHLQILPLNCPLAELWLIV